MSRQPKTEHVCENYDALNNFPEAEIGYGRALDNFMSWTEDGWGTGNGEYGIYIRYCPYCGLDLHTLKPVNRSMSQTTSDARP